MVAFGGALAGDELAVALVGVAEEQGGVAGVGAGDEERGHVEDVGGEARRGQGAEELRRGDEHLAAHVAALLLSGELVLEVHARGAGLDHALHQLEAVNGAAEAGLRVGDYRGVPVRRVVAVDRGDLVGAGERVVDALDDVGDAVGGIEALVGVGLAGEVGVGGHLPAAQIDRLQSGLDHLDRLRAGEGAEGADEGLVSEERPEALGSRAGDAVLDSQAAAQPDDVVGGVGALDTLPARFVRPAGLERRCFSGVSSVSVDPIDRHKNDPSNRCFVSAPFPHERARSSAFWVGSGPPEHPV